MSISPSAADNSTTETNEKSNLSTESSNNPYEAFSKQIGQDYLGAVYNNFIGPQFPPFNPFNCRSLWNVHAVGTKISQMLQRSPAILVPGSLSKIQVDCIEYPDCYRVFMDIPGVKKESLDIHLEEKMLLIQGERNLDYGINAECLHRERFFGPFIVHVPLTMVSIDIDNVKAVLNEGVLTIVFNKCSQPVPKKVHLVEFEKEEEEEEKDSKRPLEETLETLKKIKTESKEE